MSILGASTDIVGFISPLLHALPPKCNAHVIAEYRRCCQKKKKKKQKGSLYQTRGHTGKFEGGLAFRT